MGKKSKKARQADACIAWREIWDFLQSFDKYIADVEKQEKKSIDERTLREKWKFAPVGRRDDLGASLGLYAEVCRRLDLDFGSGKNLKLLHPDPKCLLLSRSEKGVFGPNNEPVESVGQKPKTIKFEVVNFKDPDLIADELKLMLAHVYNLFQLEVDRPRSGSPFAARFIVEMCKEQGYSNVETKDLLQRHFSPESGYPISVKVIEEYIREWRKK